VTKVERGNTFVTYKPHKSIYLIKVWTIQTVCKVLHCTMSARPHPKRDTDKKATQTEPKRRKGTRRTRKLGQRRSSSPPPISGPVPHGHAGMGGRSLRIASDAEDCPTDVEGERPSMIRSVPRKPPYSTHYYASDPFTTDADSDAATRAQLIMQRKKAAIRHLLRDESPPPRDMMLKTSSDSGSSEEDIDDEEEYAERHIPASRPLVGDSSKRIARTLAGAQQLPYGRISVSSPTLPSITKKDPASGYRRMDNISSYTRARPSPPMDPSSFSSSSARSVPTPQKVRSDLFDDRVDPVELYRSIGTILELLRANPFYMFAIEAASAQGKTNVQYYIHSQAKDVLQILNPERRGFIAGGGDPSARLKDRSEALRSAAYAIRATFGECDHDYDDFETSKEIRSAFLDLDAETRRIRSILQTASPLILQSFYLDDALIALTNQAMNEVYERLAPNSRIFSVKAQDIITGGSRQRTLLAQLVAAVRSRNDVINGSRPDTQARIAGISESIERWATELVTLLTVQSTERPQVWRAGMSDRVGSSSRTARPERRPRGMIRRRRGGV